jgi:hypothetical protein
VVGDDCQNGAVPRPLPARVGVALAVFAMAASGCAGQNWSNDDEVGPTSPRPDPRDHTLPAPARGARPAGQE